MMDRWICPAVVSVSQDFPGNGYPMKMIAGTEGSEYKYGPEIGKGVRAVDDVL